MSARRLRSAVGVALLASAAILLLPDPAQIGAHPVRATHELLDPALRVPFAATLLRAPGARLRPAERVLGVRRAGDAGLVAPRDRNALLRAIGPASSLELEVQGPGGARRVDVEVVERSTLRALLEQWPLLLTSVVLLGFALTCVLGGRHPVATPLFAVTLCLAAALGSAIDLVLPQDAGLLGLPDARARLGTLAWCALPAALLHLAARFPVVVPSFRRPALAAIPYALWAMPALVAQLRFGEAATVDAVERVALAASFVAGSVLVAACAFPGRRLSPVERVRARAALAAFVAAGAGPLVAFVRGVQPAPAQAALLALGGLALPLALGWAVVRYRLLDPPDWMRRALASGATTLVALLVCGDRDERGVGARRRRRAARIGAGHGARDRHGTRIPGVPLRDAAAGPAERPARGGAPAADRPRGPRARGRDLPARRARALHGSRLRRAAAGRPGGDLPHRARAGVRARAARTRAVAGDSSGCRSPVDPPSAHRRPRALNGRRPCSRSSHARDRRRWS